MTIGLRYRIAMTASSDCALSIRFNYPGVGFRVVSFKPAQKCWTKIKTDGRIIIENCLLPISGGGNECVRAITFGMNSFIPIVEGRSAGLIINDSGPGIFARWLIEMTVDN